MESRPPPARARYPGGIENPGVPTPSAGPPPWAGLNDEALLRLRIREVATPMGACPGVVTLVDQVRRELADRQVPVAPVIYFGDEWFSPEGMIAISVPFYLAHPRLVALERKQMLEVEGEDPAYFLRLLRHELGHCVDHAFRLSRRPGWRRLFGDPTKEYAPEIYRPRPFSRSFVQNLDHFYAQAHPDEDFAETFAVWLDPSRDWRREYARWRPALAKLEYVDRALRRLPRVPAPGTPPPRGRLPYEARRSALTLARYYARRRRERAQDNPDFFDPDLRLLFPDAPEGPLPASSFLRKNLPSLRDAVALASPGSKFMTEGLLRRMIARCSELGLRTTDGAAIHHRVAAFVAIRINHLGVRR